MADVYAYPATRRRELVRSVSVRALPVWPAALLIAGAYVATRLVFIARFPYFLDEGTYAQFTYRAAHSLHQLFISMSIGREPLQIWLGIPFVKLGFSALSAMRLVSFTAGLLTIVPVALLARRLGDQAVALAAAAICVVLPFFVVHDGIGIMEPLVTLIMASALLLSIELARRPGLRLGAALGVVLAAGILTKENTLPSVALVPAGLICFDWSAEGRPRRLKLWFAGVALAAALTVGGELILRSSSMYTAFLEARNGPFYTVRHLHTVVAHPFATWGTTWGVYWAAFKGYVTIPLIVVSGLGAALALRGQRRLALVLLVWLAFCFSISMLFAAFPFPRHVMYLMPPAIVFMAYGLVGGARWTRRRLPAALATATATLVALLLLTPALLFDGRVLAHPATAHYPGRDDWQYVTGTGAGDPWPALAQAIRHYGAHRSRVIILHPTADTTITQLILGQNSRYDFVYGFSPLARHAQLAVTDEIPFADPEALQLMKEGGAVQLAAFKRPRGGPAVRLWELRRNQ